MCRSALQQTPGAVLPWEPPSRVASGALDPPGGAGTFSAAGQAPRSSVGGARRSQRCFRQGQLCVRRAL